MIDSTNMLPGTKAEYITKMLEEHRIAINEAQRGITSASTAAALLVFAEILGAPKPRVRVHWIDLDETYEGTMIDEDTRDSLDPHIVIRFDSDGYDEDNEYEFVRGKDWNWYEINDSQTPCTITRI